LEFGVPRGPGGWVDGVILVLKTFPELVGRSVLNLVEIGPVVRARKRNIGTVSFINRLANRAPVGLGYPGVQRLGWQYHACVKNLP